MNGIICIDKPQGFTSFDVVAKLRGITKIRRIGHAGTLDPLATGVLLVCIGKATKLAEQLQAHHKEYIAGVTFGATTPSYDLEKDIDRFFPYEHITSESVASALPSFIGEQDQIAPLFSAKSVDGVRAYELARKLHKEGKTLDEAAEELIRVSRINITELELLKFEGRDEEIEDRATRGTEAGGPRAKRSGGVSEANVQDSSSDLQTSDASSRINVTDNSELGLPRAVIRISCSKGTYVRAFARDLGEALGSGAHLDSLQRSRSGLFRIENALTVDQTINLLTAWQANQ